MIETLELACLVQPAQGRKVPEIIWRGPGRRAAARLSRVYKDGRVRYIGRGARIREHIEKRIGYGSP